MATIVKKGRKPKSYYENLKKNMDISNNINPQNTILVNNDISNNLPKKRGRKPKGGKIVEVKSNLLAIKSYSLRTYLLVQLRYYQYHDQDSLRGYDLQLP